MSKDNVSKFVEFHVDDEVPTLKDLTSDLVPGSLGAVGLEFDRVEMTGSGDEVKRAMGNRANADIEARFYVNNDADRATDVLHAIDDGATAGTINIRYGEGAAPTTGDLEWAGEYILLRCKLVEDSGRMVHDCLWVPDPDTAADPAWGTVT